MRKATLLFAGCSAVLLMLAGTGTVLVAQSGQAIVESNEAPAPGAATISGIEVLKATRIATGVGTTVPSGFQPIHDPIVIKCPGIGKCTYEAQQHVQVTGAVANNKWAILTQIDGSWILGAYVGLVPDNGYYQGGNFVETKNGLAKGNHTVQTFVYSDSGLTVANWTIVYKVYKP